MATPSLDNIKYSLLVFLLTTAICARAQSPSNPGFIPEIFTIYPEIRIGYGHYGSSDRFTAQYQSNVNHESYKRKLSTNHNYFPVDIKLNLSQEIRISSRYSYGRYNAGFDERDFLRGKNPIHTWSLGVDFIFPSSENFHVMFAFGAGKMYMKNTDLDPLYFSYESPYIISSKWRGGFFNVDMGFSYIFNSIPFSLDALVSIRAGGLSLKSFEMAGKEENDAQFNADINYNGGALEFGISYRLQK